MSKKKTTDPVILRKRRKRRGVIALCVLAAVAVLICVYVYGNLHPIDETYRQQTISAGFTEKKATLADGSVISYGEGPASGPALLLIHGQGGDWTDYDSVLPALAKKFHVYAVDCFGHGQSSHDPSLYSWDANGRALAEFIQTVIGQKCYVSGHSSGGLLTAWLAANAPGQVIGAVLEDPPLFEITPAEMQEGAGCAAWVDSFVIRHNYLCHQNVQEDFTVYYLKNSYFYAMYGQMKGAIVKAAQDWRQQHPDDPVKIAWMPYSWIRGLYMKNYDLRFGEAFYTGRWVEGIDQEAMLKAVKCPVIYLKAATQYGKDGMVYAANSDEDAQRVQALIPSCETQTISSGHDIHYEHPDFFIAAMDKILAKTK